MVECPGFGRLRVQAALWTPLQGVVKLRRAISTVVLAVAFIAGAAGVAMAAGTHAGTRAGTHALHARCGTTYTPACTKPRISNKAPSPKCVNTGIRYTLPMIRFTSNAGIRLIEVRMGTKVIRRILFKGRGPTSWTVRNLRVPTLGLGSGGHLLSVRVTDVKGRSASRTLRFSVCVSTPVFTG